VKFDLRTIFAAIVSLSLACAAYQRTEPIFGWIVGAESSFAFGAATFLLTRSIRDSRPQMSALFGGIAVLVGCFCFHPMIVAPKATARIQDINGMREAHVAFDRLPIQVIAELDRTSNVKASVTNYRSCWQVKFSGSVDSTQEIEKIARLWHEKLNEWHRSKHGVHHHRLCLDLVEVTVKGQQHSIQNVEYDWDCIVVEKHDQQLDVSRTH